MTWELRPMREDDRAYVLSSWLNSYAEVGRRNRVVDRVTKELLDDGGEFRGVSAPMYFRLYQPVVEAMVARSSVFIATTPDMADTDAVLGWLAVEGEDVVHYVLTKSRWRKMGLAKWMLSQVPVVARYTHEPKPALRSRLIPAEWSFDPMRRFEERKAA